MKRTLQIEVIGKQILFQVGNENKFVNNISTTVEIPYLTRSNAWNIAEIVTNKCSELRFVVSNHEPAITNIVELYTTEWRTLLDEYVKLLLERKDDGLISYNYHGTIFDLVIKVI